MQNILGQTITVRRGHILRASRLDSDKDAVVVFVGEHGVGAMFEDGSCTKVLWEDVLFPDSSSTTLAVNSGGSTISYFADNPA